MGFGCISETLSQNQSDLKMESDHQSDRKLALKMKKMERKNPSADKKTPFLYRSFFNFWLSVVLPLTVIALIISKLYYNNTINFEPLTEPSTWLYFVILHVFVSFFTYLWVYRLKAKKHRS